MPKHRSAGGESSFAMIRHLKEPLFPEIRHPKKRAFLAAFSETGSVIRASAKAGIDRHNHSLWIRKDQIYAAAFDLAKEIACDTLESEAVRRAGEGVEGPVFYRGTQCGVIRRYSDKLLMFLLKGVAPEKYREHWESEIPGPREGRIATDATAQAHALADLFSPDALEGAYQLVAEVPLRPTSLSTVVWSQRLTQRVQPEVDFYHGLLCQVARRRLRRYR